MRFIGELKEDDQVTDHYLCVRKQSLKTRAGKTYFSLILQDKTGQVDAKIWDLNNGISHFEEGDYIKVDALVISYQNSLQMNVRRIRQSDESEIDPTNFVPTSQYDLDEMYQELLAFVDRIENPYMKELAEKFFVEDQAFAERFKQHSAAKRIHHSFMGGLLEHTLGILKICDFLTMQYPKVNRDLLFIGALFHDMAKTRELSEFPMVNYTDEGQLVGHLVMAVEWINEKIADIPDFPKDISNLVKHIVLAHHGELEYGSPKKPAILEAMLLHYADNIDAKVMTITSMLEEADTDEDWIGYQRILETNLRKTRF